MVRRPSRRDIIASSGLIAAGLAGCIGSAGEVNENTSDDGSDFERTLDWKGQGSEYADLDCPDDTGYWKWVLAPGGPGLGEDALLTVIFEDSDEVKTEGYRPGEGGGAIHFDVFKEGGGTVETAHVEFNGGGRNPILTISEGYCLEDEPDIEIKTRPATDVNASTATLQGELTEIGAFEEVIVYFEWRNVEDEEWTQTELQTLNAIGTFSAGIEGLKSGHQYEFRAVAETDGQRVVGATLGFDKPEKEPPEVKTHLATDINESTATLNGELTVMGDYDEVNVYFEWREEGAEEWMVTDPKTLTEHGQFSAHISGLVVSNTYEFRAIAEANEFRAVGDIKTFEKEKDVEPEKVYWQVDFGEGKQAPVPPHYWPNDGLFALGTSEGTIENPSFSRTQSDGQLGDVSIEDHAFQFDDDDNPTEVSVTFTVDEDGDPRYLHLAVFTLPGPYDPDEVDEQELYEEVSMAYDGGESDTLTLSLPTQED